MIKTKSYLLFFLFFLIFPFFSQAQSQVTLTWSTDTYVPLDYSGKALPTRKSNIEVVASISSSNPENLLYNWFINDKLQEVKSGKGKQTFTFNTGERISQRFEVKTRVSDEKESFIIFSPVLTIALQSPEIVLKTKTAPLEPLKYIFSSNQEIRFTAQPYFFNIKRADELSYDWSFNGERATKTDDANPNTFILKISQLVQSITKKLTVWAEDEDNLLEKAQTEVEINIIP